jgi:Arabinose efflux permease
VTEQPTQDQEPTTWLTPGVASVGAASFFSDAGHEMATSLLPGFVTGVLGGGASALAAIDGVADALTGLAKLAGGPLAADPRRRGWLARSGYLGTALATAAIGATTAVWQVAGLRAIAWMARGVRSPARDMVLTDLTHRRGVGRAFGLERAGDNLGAIVGPLLASALVGVLGVRTTILLAFIPGLLAAVAISIAVGEARTSLSTGQAKARLSLNLRELRSEGIVGTLVPISMFELGNLANTLLILRATDLLTGAGWQAGAAAGVAVLCYAGHNAVAVVGSLVGGHLIDRLGPRLVFGLGAGSFVLAYLTFAFGDGLDAVIGGFALAGFGIGLAETAESAVVALSTSTEHRSHAFGLLGLVQSIGDLGATVVAGILWSAVSPQLAFGYAAAWMAASVLSGRLVRRHPAATPTP